ncbi:hypothetical protein GGF31_006529, partial [Allomyces arbusculus]
MGVQGLHAYVEQQGLLKDACFPDPSQDAATPDEQEQVAVVLDGNALIHRLYFDALDWILGGQYSVFALVLQRYLAQFAAADVRVAKVIFDGGRGSPAKQVERLARDTRKTSQAYHAVQPLVHNASVSLHKGSVVHDETDTAGFMPARKSRRHRTRRSFGTSPVIPLLAIPHAIRVLREMGVPVAVAQDEADRVVAAEANALNAYAVSRDSDYYIFPLVKGYISMDSISFGDGAMSCKVYQVESLAQAAKVPVPLLPILATAMGNDYVAAEQFGHDIYRLVHPTVGNLSVSQQVAAIRQCLHRALRDYDMDHIAVHGALQHVVTYVDATPKCHVATSTTKRRKKTTVAKRPASAPPAAPSARWTELGDLLSRSVREYDLPVVDENGIAEALQAAATGDVAGALFDVVVYRTFFCTPVLEDMARPSAWTISRPLRAALYGKHALDSVTEKVRRAGTTEIGSVVVQADRSAADAAAATVGMLESSPFHLWAHVLHTTPPDLDALSGTAPSHQFLAVVLRFLYTASRQTPSPPPVPGAAPPPHDSPLALTHVVAFLAAAIAPLDTDKVTAVTMRVECVHTWAQVEAAMLSLHMLVEAPLPAVDSVSFWAYATRLDGENEGRP